MPDYGNPGQGAGNEDLYSDSAPAEAPVEEAETESEGGSTAVLPKDFFQGKELTPGTVCSVKIERVHDSQVEVSYVPHEAEEEAEAPPAAAPPGAAQEMTGMMA